MVGKTGACVVALDRDKGSQSAFIWALDNLLLESKTLILLHITIKPAMSPRSVGSKCEKDFFLPYRCFCTRRHIECDEVILEDVDASRGILEYVQGNAIEKLVLGAPGRGGLFKKFKTDDVPSLVSKRVPNFCTVYIIGKGKVTGQRPATMLPPPKPAQRKHSQPQTTHTSDISIYKNGRAEMGQQTPRKQQDEMDFQSPFNRKGFKGTYRPSVAESDISFVGNAMPRREYMFPAFFDNPEPESTARSSTSSDIDGNRSSFAETFSAKESMDLGSLQVEFNACTGESGRLSCSSQNIDDVESEMRRLKMELRQTMDMYSLACKEALVAKQKATELHRWKIEEVQRVGDAKLTEESSIALVEREKAKSMAAIEAETEARATEELEVQKTKQAEMKAMKDSEEKNRFMITQDDFRYRKYTIEEIEHATDCFSKSRKIGEGGYGTVYLASLDHTPVAIKVLRSDTSQGLSQFHQEVDVLTCMRHPNMVLLVGACPEQGCLVYEYMSNGSLGDRLARLGNTPPLPWQLRFRIAAEITTGLLFLHQTKPEPIVHRDLKPANILLDRNFVSKISDVGLARLVPGTAANTETQYRMTATAGTFCYIDPEYQQSGMLGTKSDVYALGIIFLQMITARPPMGLTHLVERAIERGTFERILDPTVPDWPIEEVLSFARLALQCAELRRKDRPDLGRTVLPELNRLRELAEETMPAFTRVKVTRSYSGRMVSTASVQVTNTSV